MPHTRKPTVGDVVHYVHFGVSGADMPRMCVAAIVTEVLDENNPLRSVGLVIFNPTGLQFHSAAVDHSQFPSGSTWHWPEGQRSA